MVLHPASGERDQRGHPAGRGSQRERLDVVGVVRMVVGVDDAGQDITPGRVEGLPRRAGADLRCHLGDDAVGDRYVGAPDAVA